MSKHSARYYIVYFRADTYRGGECEVSLMRDSNQDSMDDRLGGITRPSDGHSLFASVDEAQRACLEICREFGRIGGCGIGIYRDGNLVSQRNIDQFEPR